mmetsp:Transcript_195/g.756  ORF Transcript_195/g.756 Transcript_195/m.756 type:complete len:231 (-) Transcript_195:987-1679(-)
MGPDEADLPVHGVAALNFGVELPPNLVERSNGANLRWPEAIALDEGGVPHREAARDHAELARDARDGQGGVHMPLVHPEPSLPLRRRGIHKVKPRTALLVLRHEDRSVRGLVVRDGHGGPPQWQDVPARAVVPVERAHPEASVTVQPSHTAVVCGRRNNGRDLSAPSHPAGPDLEPGGPAGLLLARFLERGSQFHRQPSLHEDHRFVHIRSGVHARDPGIHGFRIGNASL